MADYMRMYHRAFHALTDASRLLEQAMEIIESAQLECEDIFITTDESFGAEEMDVEF